MTYSPSSRLFCEWCHGDMPKPSGPGRPRRYCRPSHRQRAYEARRMAERRGIAPDEVLVSRRSWNGLRDALYRLQTAAEDVALDITQGRATKTAYVEALAHLSSAVRELQDVVVEPIAIAEP